MPSSSPIVILDSGLGGLTVVRAVRAALPDENILYFGDTARLPYGSKTPETVTGFVRQILHFLRPFRPKHAVIACNTATALSLSAIRAEFSDLPITGVIEPGAKAAVVAAGHRPVPIIGVIATEATIRSRAYERAIVRRRAHARLLLKPTPLLVPIIEEGRAEDDPLVRLALRQYLAPLVKHRMEVLVLGCTHYPILKGLIADLLGPKVAVIDSAEQCAHDVARRLRAAGLANEPKGATFADDANARGALRCFVTDDASRFARLASRFLGFEVATPTWVSPDELYATAAPESLPMPLPVGEPEAESQPAVVPMPIRLTIPA